jgi:hypothetical protein
MKGYYIRRFERAGPWREPLPGGVQACHRRSDMVERIL